jgi:hypothetical protein
MDLDIKRNGSRPSAKGSPDWLTGSVRVDLCFSPSIRRGSELVTSPSSPGPVPIGTRIRSGKP